MASYGNNFKIKHIYLGDTKLRKSFANDIKLWSGASIVNYYDGSTLLGTREIDEGFNVLTPSIIPAKANMTFLGWNTDSTAEEPLSTLVATGEPMNLYAVYYETIYHIYNGGAIHSGISVTGTSYSTPEANPHSKSFGIGGASVFFNVGESNDISCSFSIRNLPSLKRYNRLVIVGGNGSASTSNSSWVGLTMNFNFNGQTATVWRAHSQSWEEPGGTTWSNGTYTIDISKLETKGLSISVTGNIGYKYAGSAGMNISQIYLQ